MRTVSRLGAVGGGGGLALLAALLVSSLAPTCNPPASVPATAPEAADVRTVEDLVECLNDKLAQVQGDVSIADTVQCIPPCCTVTLTMSRSSAQAGCFMGGSGDPNPPGMADPAPTIADTQGEGPRCQLPRIILDCPGPPELMPSYSLCPIGSESDEAQGSNRIEVGQVIDCNGNMRMGDIPIPPGPFDAENEPIEDVISTVDGGQGTKNCNVCHGNPQQNPPMGADEISDPMAIAPECVICTDDPHRTGVSANCQQKQGGDPRVTTKVTTTPCLSEICGCIEEAVDTTDHPLDTDQGDILLLLCQALESYQGDRGVCGGEECPAPSGPTCSPPQIGSNCCGATGEFAGQATGYSCEEVGTEVQCVPTQGCVDFSELGGGKFLMDGTVSMCRVEVTGQAATDDPGTVSDSMDVGGSVSAFNYWTETYVESTSISSFQASFGGGGFTATGTAEALVDGFPAQIGFVASEGGSGVICTVSDGSGVLAGGVGETGRADLELTITPVP